MNTAWLDEFLRDNPLDLSREEEIQYKKQFLAWIKFHNFNYISDNLIDFFNYDEWPYRK
jgi:hypothetical protein